MKKQNYEKLKDIEKFYYKKKRDEYNKLMKKRRRRTYIVAIISVLVIIGAVSYKGIFSKEYSNYLKVFGNSDKIDNDELNKEFEDFKKKIDIDRVDYKWESNITKSNSPEVLVIHHSVSRGADPSEIHKWHKDKGYGGIGYHYYIKKDGHIYKGREDDVMGAHAYDHNWKTLAICLDGNFEEDELTKEQRESLINLSTSLVVSHNLKDIVGHRDCNETLCPGKNIDIENIKQEVLNNIKEKSKKI